MHVPSRFRFPAARSIIVAIESTICFLRRIAVPSTHSTLWLPQVQQVLERLHTLAEYADIRPGDALQTLRDTGGIIDVLLLDGWKELYRDILDLVSASLRPGSVVLADDVTRFPDQLAPYLKYIRDPAHGFVSVLLPIGDGIEYSVKV